MCEIIVRDVMLKNNEEMLQIFKRDLRIQSGCSYEIQSGKYSYSYIELALHDCIKNKPKKTV